MQVAISVDTTELLQLYKDMEKAGKKWRAIATKRIRPLGDTTKAIMVNELKPTRTTGKLERSIHKDSDVNDQGFTLTVGPDAEHAQYIRYGTRPHWVPIAPLKRWAAIKLGDANAAYAVQKSIAKHGTSRWSEVMYGDKANVYTERTLGRPQVQRALRDLEQGIADDITAAVVKGK